MVDNSKMPHPKCLGSQKNLGTEPKTCEKGPKLGFEYLPTSKTLHCVHGIPNAHALPTFGRGDDMGRDPFTIFFQLDAADSDAHRKP